MRFNLIVAMCKDSRGIGLNGNLPWNIKEDLHYFSKLTKGDGNNAVIMGSNTYKSLKRETGLPGRDNLILYSNEKFLNNDNVKAFTTIDKIIETCYANNYDTAWIIGGASIYKQFLDRSIIDACYVTLIHKVFECDTFFPFLNETEWTVVEKTELIHKKSDEFKVECNNLKGALAPFKPPTASGIA